jgi:hypothetical protein
VVMFATSITKVCEQSMFLLCDRRLKWDICVAMFLGEIDQFLVIRVPKLIVEKG